MAVGIWLILYSRKTKTVSGALIGVSSIILGIGSFIFHATGTCLGGELDYLGMFSITGVLTGLNLRRLFLISWRFTYTIIVCPT